MVAYGPNIESFAYAHNHLMWLIYLWASQK
jgi:hypothetical protein